MAKSLRYWCTVNIQYRIKKYDMTVRCWHVWVCMCVCVDVVRSWTGRRTRSRRRQGFVSTRQKAPGTAVAPRTFTDLDGQTSHDPPTYASSVSGKEIFSFLSRDAVYSADYADTRCLSVCLSVTGRCFVETPLRVGSRRNLSIRFDVEKLEWCGYLTV